MLKERLAPKTEVKVYETFQPSVSFSHLAITKINALIDNGGINEIGWLCQVAKIDTQDYIVEDIHLPKQDVHATTTEINSDGLNELCMELLKDEVNGVENYNKVRGWGHSHVNMGVSPSGQDNTQMKLFVENGCEYFIRMIGNKKGVMIVDVFDYSHGLVFLDVKWNVLNAPEAQLIEEQIYKLYAEIDTIHKSIKEEVIPLIKAEIPLKVKHLSNKAFNRSAGYSAYDWNKQRTKKKPSETNAPSATNANPLDDPKTFDDLNIIYSEDEVYEIGITLSYWIAKSLIEKVSPMSETSYIMNVWRICQKYVEDLDAEIAKNFNRKDEVKK